MEEEGIGRPSTYATIVKGLRTKKYAYGAKSIIPSDLGRVLTSYLKKVFEEFFIETEFSSSNITIYKLEAYEDIEKHWVANTASQLKYINLLKINIKTKGMQQ